MTTVEDVAPTSKPWASSVCDRASSYAEWNHLARIEYGSAMTAAKDARRRLHGAMEAAILSAGIL